MAVNDLMMRIQLLVDSGKSSAELKRIQQALAALSKQTTQLDRVRLTPLRDDLDGLRKAATNLKSVNLSNFANSINDIQQGLVKFGIPVTNINRLRKAFQELDQQIQVNRIGQYQTQLRTLNQELRRARQLNLTGSGQGANTNYLDLQRELARYQDGIRNITNDLLKHRRTILDIKKQIADIGKYKFDANLFVELQKLNTRRGLKNQPFSVIDKQSIATIADYNSLLASQKNRLLDSQQKATIYRNELARLRLEAQRLKTIDLSNITIGGNTRNLIGDLEKAGNQLRAFRSQQIIPLQNEIRTLQATASLNKALNIDPARKQVALYNVQIKRLALAIKEASAAGNDAKATNFANQLETLYKKSLNLSEGIAQRELSIAKNSAQVLAQKKEELEKRKNSLALYQDEERSIKALIASQKQFAQQAAQQVKTRTGGIIDTTESLNNEKKIGDIYKQNLATLKQYLGERKNAATLESNIQREALLAAQNQLVIGQITKAQYRDRVSEIRNEITAEKEKSKIYQQSLQNQVTGIRDAISLERERIASLKTQIGQFKQLSGIDVQNQIGITRSQLESAKANLLALKEQEQTLKNLTNEEISRVNALERSGRLFGVFVTQHRALKGVLNDLDQQYKQITTKISDLSKKSGLAQEYISSIKSNGTENLTNKLLELNNQLNITKSNAGLLRSAYNQSIKSITNDLRVARSEYKKILDEINTVSSGTGQIPFERADLASRKSLAYDTIKLTQERLAIERQAYSEASNNIKKEISNINQSTEALQRNIDALKSRSSLFANLNSVSDVKKQVSDTIQQIRNLQTALGTTDRNFLGQFQEYNDLRSQLRTLREIQIAYEQINRSQRLTPELTTQKNALNTRIQDVKEYMREISVLNRFMQGFRFMLTPEMLGMSAFNMVIGSVHRMISAFTQVNSAAETLTRGLNAVFGKGQGEVQFDNLIRIANKYGLELQELSRNYLNLNASANGTILQGAESERIFKSLSAAMAVLGADTITTQRAFRAVGQMISKGQVYAEELKGQLAEALPGAVQLFAKSMGKTSQEFLAMVKAGQVGLNDLIPFFREIEKTYGDAALLSTTYEQATNRLSNSWTLLLKALGDTGAWSAVVSSVDSASRALMFFAELAGKTISDQLKEIEKTRPIQLRLEINQSDFDKFQDIILNGDKGKLTDIGFVRNIQEYTEALKQRNRENEETNKLIDKQTEGLRKLQNEQDLQNINNQINQIDAMANSLMNYEMFVKTLSNSFNNVRFDQTIKEFQDLQKQLNLLYINPNASSSSIKELESNIEGLAKRLSRYKIKTPFGEFSLPEYQNYLNAAFKKYEEDQSRRKSLSDRRNQLIQSNEEDGKLGNRVALTKQLLREEKALLDIQQRSQTTLQSLEATQSSRSLKGKGVSDSLVTEYNAVQSLMSGYKALNDVKALETKFNVGDDQEQIKQVRELQIDQLRYAANIGRTANNRALLVAIMREEETLQRSLIEKSSRSANTSSLTNTVQDQIRGIDQLFNRSNAQLNEFRRSLMKSLSVNEQIVRLNETIALRKVQSQKQAKDLEFDINDALRTAKNVNEQNAATRVRRLNDVRGIERQIQEAQQKAAEVSEAAITARLNDARALLRLEIRMKDEIKSTDQRAKELRSGTPEDRSAAFWTYIEGYKIEKQATEELEKAAKAKTDTEKKGLLETAQLLIENAIAKYREAGETYKLKQAYEQLKTIQAQLSESSQRDAENRKKSAEAVRLEKEAVEAKGKAENEQVATTKSEYIQIAQERAKLAQQKFADLGMKEEATRIGEVIKQLELMSQTNEKLRNQDSSAAKAQEQYAEATQLMAQANQSAIAAEATELRKLAQERAKAALSSYASAGDEKGIENIRQLISEIQRLNTEADLKVEANIAQQIEQLRQQFNATDIQGLTAALQQQRTFLQSELNNLLRQVGQQESEEQRNQLQEKIAEIKKNIGEFDRQYQQVVSEYQSMAASGNAPSLKLQSSLAEVKPEEISVVYQKAQEKVNEIGSIQITSLIDLKYNEVPKLDLPTLTQYVDVVYRERNAPSGSSNMDGFAAGGLIPGGYSSRDSVLAKLAPGEFVIPSHIVEKFGPQYFYDFINQRRPKLKENISIPRFASGGMVSGNPIVINVPGSKPIHLSGSRDAAMQLVNVLTRTGRAL